jgi:hypothetical protein
VRKWVANLITYVNNVNVGKGNNEVLRRKTFGDIIPFRI